MGPHCKDYVWKDGIPYGLQAVKDELSGLSYKIVSDPYRKRISIEKYQGVDFTGVVYDSALLDFRHLKKPEHVAWQKSQVNEGNLSACHIRNQDDRLLFIETYYFDKDLCKECCVHSPHGLPLSVQRMHYMICGDPFNGVVLFDMNGHPVMYKRYEFDEESRQFTELVEEQWDMVKHHAARLCYA